MENNLSVADALALQRDGYNGMDGFGGGGIWWILIIFFVLFAGNGNGLFGGGNANGQLNADFITRDLFNINQNVTQQGCNTQKEILESRFTTQLGFQAQQAQLAQCCCDIKQEIHADGEATRALINANTVQDLRDSLNTANLQLSQQAQSANLINQLRPCPIPAYLSCSPYQSFDVFGRNGCGGCGCNNI